MNTKNNPVSFVRRYWQLIVLFFVSFWLCWIDIAFGVAGAMIYLPVLSFGAILVTLAIRHYFFRKSLDDDAHSGYFVWAFRRLSERDRVFANIIMTSVLFLGVCWIAAALIK